VRRRPRQPVSRAIERVDRCIAVLGAVSSVLTTTCSTCASVTIQAPGSGLVDQPVQAILDKQPPPGPHRRATHTQPPRDLAVAQSSAAASTTRERIASAPRRWSVGVTSSQAAHAPLRSTPAAQLSDSASPNRLLDPRAHRSCRDRCTPFGVDHRADGVPTSNHDAPEAAPVRPETASRGVVGGSA
jgi:hypothetical protein